MITLVFTVLTMTFTSSFADDQPKWEKGSGDVNVLLYYRPGGAYDRMNQSVIIPLLGVASFCATDGNVSGVFGSGSNTSSSPSSSTHLQALSGDIKQVAADIAQARKRITQLDPKPLSQIP